MKFIREDPLPQTFTLSPTRTFTAPVGLVLISDAEHNALITRMEKLEAVAKAAKELDDYYFEGDGDVIELGDLHARVRFALDPLIEDLEEKP